METAELRRSTLQRKDREELSAIATALGQSPALNADKGELIQLILDLTASATSQGDGKSPAQPATRTSAASTAATSAVQPAPAQPAPAQAALAQAETSAPESPGPPSSVVQTSKHQTSQTQTSQVEGGHHFSNAGSPSNPDQESNSKNRRRRGRERENNKDTNEPYGGEVVQVEGFLELRPEGYGFLRVDGALPSKDDAYVPVKMVRQYKLSKGIHMVGTCRPAARNEKNPAMVELLTINGRNPDLATERTPFDDLVPVYPNEKLQLGNPDGPFEPTGAIIDCLAPLGKGQRAMIASAPRSGKTTVLKRILRSLEDNHSEVELLVLLIDERPEDITDMERHLQRGEVIGTPFDQPSDEQIVIAEMTIERAKRLVEDGRDVCLVVDGITRLARAHILESSHGGRSNQVGIDRNVVYACKRFLAAARNIEGGGSLTMVSTIVVDNDSQTDALIYEELANTTNWELRLSRDLAVRRIYPAVDVVASGTHNEELLLTEAESARSRKLRQQILAKANESEAAPGDDVLELLSELSDEVAVGK